jgi:excisionase family DNA binding protein
MSSAGPKPVAPQEQFIGTTEAAKLMGITPRHARRIAQRLGVPRVGNRYLIPLDALEELDDDNIR